MTVMLFSGPLLSSLGSFTGDKPVTVTHIHTSVHHTSSAYDSTPTYFSKQPTKPLGNLTGKEMKMSEMARHFPKLAFLISERTQN